MEYKTELHCHSRDVSTCSDASVENIVEKYLEYGYTTVVLTNHLHDWSFVKLGKTATWHDKAAFFIDGYTKLAECAAGRLNILLGAEIRFPGSVNDYLWFGFDEDFMYGMEEYMNYDVYKFIGVVRENSQLLIQAHPCRFGITVINPAALDGVEVFNGHPGQCSNNNVAQCWADNYPKLIVTSGTDHHDTWHMPDAGIITDFPITSTDELVKTLRSRNYSLIRDTDTMQKSKN